MRWSLVRADPAGRSAHVIASWWKGAALGAVLVALAGCSAQARSGSDRAVTVAWEANHEKGVNGPGGGYRVTVAGRDPIDLPWPSPTTLTTVLSSGRHGVSVQAYEPDPAGTGTAWSPAATLTVVVP
jgi:hypothetical protein